MDIHFSKEKRYSKRLQHLRELSRRVRLTEEYLQDDDRLAYLVSK